MRKNRSERLLVGGLVEPFALGGSAPTNRIKEGQSDAVLTAGLPAKFFAMENLIAMTSWALGGFLSEYGFTLDRYLFASVPYWSPMTAAARTDATALMYGDGGIIDNYHLVS